MTIIIPLIKGGSKSSDTELLYSLRSIEKHVTGVTNIAIVSDYLPKFLNPEAVTWVVKKDIPGEKQQSIKEKIIAAFDHPEVTKTALFTNDDIMFTQNVSISDFKTYYSGDLSAVAEKGARQLAGELKRIGKPTRHADIHTPIIYEAEKFKEAIPRFSPETVIKSAYANYWETEGEELKDLKINSSLNYHRIKQEIEGRPCFSVGDYGCQAPMRQVWAELYPEPSKYELINQIKAA